MRISRFLSVALIAFVSNISFAQSTYKEEVDAAQAIFGKDKKELIVSLIKMSPEEAAKFWPLYDAYETERKALGQQRLQLIKELADAFQNMTPEKADAVSEKAIKLSEQNEKLLASYYRKIRKATSAGTALEFYQAEIYILTQIRAVLMSEIPLYSDVKPAK